MHCPLCDAKLHETFETRRKPIQRFWHCTECDLVSKDPGARVSTEEERRIYELHENGDEGHRAFLQPVVEAVAAHVAPGAEGLDWGSGPVAVLSEMLAARGFRVSGYDPIFGPADIPSRPFAFVTMTEVVEHFREPAAELDRLRPYLSNGLLFVQTAFHPGGSLDEVAAFFEDWGYRMDPTHVSFFSHETIARLEGFSLVRRDGRVAILKRTAGV